MSYNILYRCLKRINFLFKTPASPFSPGWPLIGECVFSSRICDNVRSVFWNSFTWKGFPETNQDAIINELFTINEWTVFFGLITIFYLVAAALVPWHIGLSVLGTMDLYPKLMQLELGEEHIPVLSLGSLLKSDWKGQIYTEDPFSNFVSLDLSDNDIGRNHLFITSRWHHNILKKN